MCAHADDLRAEVQNDELVRQIRTDYRQAAIEERTRALLAYAEKLTRSPASMCEQDVEELRRHGYSDRAILDAAQVTAYFNYINRIADGLGVDLEPEYPPHPKAEEKQN